MFNFAKLIIVPRVPVTRRDVVRNWLSRLQMRFILWMVKRASRRL